MDNDNVAVEFIEPKNELIIKTGIGGLKQTTLDAIQARIETMKLDIEPFLKSKFATLKASLYSEDFMSESNEDVLYDFLSDLVAFNVHIKLIKNNGLSHISNSLLTFTEKLDQMNVDSFHVMKAHVNAIEIVLKTSLTGMNQDVINAFIKELNNACDRYNAKYNGGLRTR